MCFYYFIYFSEGVTKPCTHLHPALFTSTQLHPPPPSSFQPPPSLFQLPLSSLQHPQQYLNQNIARNWAISPNLGWKIQSCPFWLKIGSHGILEVLIPNPDLDFWNFDPKIYFLGKFVPKKSKLSVLSESWYTWYLEDANSYSKICFLNFQLKIPFRANLGQKSQSYPFCLKIGTHGISRCRFLFQN